MEKILKDLGFEKADTKIGMFFYGYLDNGSCIEVKVNEFIDIYFVSAMCKECRLTQFSKDVNVDFLKGYMTDIITAFGD